LAGSGTLSTITGLGGSGGGGQVYFLNLSNTQTPYKEFSPVATTAIEQSTGTSISSGVTSTLASFLSPVGYPSVNLLPAGVWSFYLHTYKTNIGDSFTTYAQVYKRTSGGTETLLFSTDPATVDGVNPTPRMVLSDVYYSGTSLDLTDRILVVIKGTNGGTSTSTLTLVTEGSLYYSYATTTFGGGTPIYTTGGTYNNSTGILTFTRTDGNTYTAGTFSYITATTLSAANVLSVASNGGSPTTTTINAVTGGTYSSGTITLSGTGNFQSTITGLDALTPTTFYSGDGSLSGNRVINLSSNTLNFSSSTLPGTVLFLSSGTVNIGTSTPDGTKFYVNTSISAAKFVSTQSTALSVIGGANGNPIATFSTTSGTVEKVRVSSGGFLGVGTTSPSNALHVSATTDPVRFVGLQSASDTSLLTVDGTGVVHTVSTSSIGGLTWNNATATQSATANNGYVGTATTLTTITLPSTAAFGSVIEVVGTGTGLWQISQNANQFIKFGITGTTTGTGGYLSATSQYDCVKLLCTSANTAFVVTSAIGNIFYN